MALRTGTPPARAGLRWTLRAAAAALLVAWGAIAAWQTGKPLPDGTHVLGEVSGAEAGSLQFLADTTASDAFGQPILSQQLQEATLALIGSAKDVLVLDYFLFNSQRAGNPAAAADHRLQGVAQAVRNALLERRRSDPLLPILVLVDPINVGYEHELSADLRQLKEAGIDVVLTNLDDLRDSNALYSAFWRLAFKWWLPDSAGGVLPNLVDGSGPGVSLGAFLRLLNFKADHRKLVITGDGHGSLRGIVSSANPHDASSAHSNVGLLLAGPALLPLLESEIALARAAGWPGTLSLAAVSARATPVDAQHPLRVRVATEGALREALVGRVDATLAGDSIEIAMFYLSDRRVIRGLLAAAHRGVGVRVILDPNKDAFGYEKSGLPNRQVAAELVAASDGAIRVRWYRTHGEQFHAKLVLIGHGDATWLLAGSANLTRRNLNDYNLESGVIVEGPRTAEPLNGALQWFERLWMNRAVGGIEYTADVDVYADPSQGRYWLYRFLEATGLSTF